MSGKRTGYLGTDAETALKEFMSTDPVGISRPQSLELAKWVAFALMLGDHVNLYLLNGALPVLYLLGRLVFPMFAFCLAFGVAGKGALTLDGVVRRLLMWACVAQIPWSLVHHSAALNVVFQLWAGAALFQAAFTRDLGWLRIVLAVVALPVGILAEFSLGGLLLVFGALWWAESRSRLGGITAQFGLALLFAVNGTWFALLAPLAFYGVSMGPELPRVRHVFYPLYAAHFVALALARHFL